MKTNTVRGDERWYGYKPTRGIHEAVRYAKKSELKFFFSKKKACEFLIHEMLQHMAKRNERPNFVDGFCRERG